MRKRFWINVPLQLNIVYFVSILLAITAVILFLTVNKSMIQISDKTHQIFLPIETIRRAIQLPYLFSGFICLLAAAVLTLLWSHRFVGPLKVIENALKNLSDGKYDFEIRSRETDALKDIIQLLKKVQEILKSRK
ncbi:MAG: hypothetical protein HY400_06975 [Elusimicrobia bacterium]|nr:hypothetical protein [Elusimicrobiota bacterium]